MAPSGRFDHLWQNARSLAERQTKNWGRKMKDYSSRVVRIESEQVEDGVFSRVSRPYIPGGSDQDKPELSYMVG